MSSLLLPSLFFKFQTPFTCLDHNHHHVESGGGARIGAGDHEQLLRRFRIVPGGTRKDESAKYNPKSGPHQFVSYAFSDRDREYIEAYLHTLTKVPQHEFLRGFKGFGIKNNAWRIPFCLLRCDLVKLPNKTYLRK
jgi:hypothetical protein